jgi:hypothetical protein
MFQSHDAKFAEKLHGEFHAAKDSLQAIPAVAKRPRKFASHASVWNTPSHFKFVPKGRRKASPWKFFIVFNPVLLVKGGVFFLKITICKRVRRHFKTEKLCRDTARHWRIWPLSVAAGPVPTGLARIFKCGYRA